jgi:hypothetical protein
MAFFQGLASPGAGMRISTMATRLYPVTTDTTILEKLAGVPAGTHQRFEELRKIAECLSRYEAYDLIQNDDDMANYDNFCTFGYGRINYQLVDDLGYDNCSGRTNLPEHVRAIARHHAIFEHNIQLLIESGGVCWS